MLLTQSNRKNLGPVHPVLIQNTGKPPTCPAWGLWPVAQIGPVADRQRPFSSRVSPSQAVDWLSTVTHTWTCRPFVLILFGAPGVQASPPLWPPEKWAFSPGQPAARSLQACEPHSGEVGPFSRDGSQLWTPWGSLQLATALCGRPPTRDSTVKKYWESLWIMRGLSPLSVKHWAHHSVKVKSVHIWENTAT